MRKVFFIGLKDVKIRSRDPASFIVLLAMPLILIFILGLVFQPLWTNKPFTINVAVFNEDRGKISKMLIEDVFGSNELKDMIKIQSFKSEEEIIKNINKGKFAAGIVIKKGFSESIMKGENAKIEVYGDPEQTIKAGIVKNIVESFTLEVLKRRIVIGTALGFLRSENLIQPSEIQKLIPMWLSKIKNKENLVSVTKETEKKHAKNPLAMEYYAVGMGVMYLLFATNSGAETILEERRIKTFDRIKVAPVGEKEILGGKLFGIFLVGLLQFVIIIMFTSIFYKVNWGDSAPGIIIMILSAVLAFSGFSTLLASFAKNQEQIGNIGSALSMIFGFLGGAMWPVFTFPKWMNIASKFTPNRWALDGFFKLMYDGGGVISILPYAFVLLIMASIFFFIGVSRLKLKGV